MKFVPTQILVTASEELEAAVEEELNNPTFPADPLSVIAENTVSYVGPQQSVDPTPRRPQA